MVGIVSEDLEAGDEQMMLERLVNSQRCQPADSLEEWWSCEQAENGMASTCPPYWDTDNDDDGPKPSELYGQFTWKLENFSTISKREMRSDPFEAGGYKWNVLIYPHGCDVCNHLSLFLCVADHEKLLPGWSHFAQFTIAVVNKDTKKSKYSDTLHRFWKKEHDWGWKKFMELSKVFDGFIVADTLVIKTQVQVIREKACRPFRCLDYRYRRDLVHTYLPNVEQICRRFVEERRGKLSKLIEDKIRWSSFRVFWLGIDQNARRRMSRDRTDAILRVVVKHFFIEKEVTSTLVMDSLYSGLKALEYQSKNMKGSSELLEMDGAVTPMIHIEKDMFVLADDVLPLLERAASAPLPHQILGPKDDKGLQNRTKDGSFGKINKDSIERDERFLTELGRRTVEIFILTHIFSRIEIAYQEVVALKRQEELIREEEAWHAENELKARLAASEKEKRSKKKQAKKRNSQKGKVRGRSENTDATLHDKHQPDDPSVEKSLEDFCSKDIQLLEKLGTLEGVSSVSDAADEFLGTVQPDLEDGDTSTINWDTDTLESGPTSETSGSRMQNGQIERRSPSIMDDSSSTCSTDSVPFVVISGRYKGNSMRNGKSQTSPERGKNQRNKKMREQSGSIHGGHNLPSYTTVNSDGLCNITGTSSVNPPEPDYCVLSSKEHIQLLEKHLVEKEEVVTLQKKLNIKDQSDVDRCSKSAVAEPSSSSATPGTKSCAISQRPKQTSEMKADTSIEASSSSPTQTEKSVRHSPKSPKSFSQSESQRQITPEKSIASSQVTAVSRPSSAPLSPDPRPTASVVPTVQTMPLLSRSASAAGRLGSDPSPSAQSYIPRSYRNAIIGKTSMGSSPAGHSQPSLRSSSQDAVYTRSSSSALSSQAYVRKDQSAAMPSLTFGSVKPGGVFHSQNHYSPSFTRNVNDDARLNSNDELRQKQYANGGPLSGSGRPPILVMSEEFPHLDIINDLLDEEQNIVNAANIHHQQYPYQPHSLCSQYSFPGSMADIGSSRPALLLDHTEQYYDNGFTTFYGSSNGPLDGTRNTHFQQADLAAFNSSRMDGLIQNHWPYNYKLAGITDLSMLNFENTYNGYPYQGTDYSSVTCGVNGYAMYHPGNGL